MKNLWKAEFKSGGIFRKVIIFLIWILLLWNIFHQLSGLNRLFPDGNFPESDRNRLIILVVLQVAYLILMIRRGLRFSCVPYWNKIFSTAQLAELLEDEEFLPAYGLDSKKFSYIKVSDNWIMIKGRLFSKHLTAFMEGDTTIYHPQGVSFVKAVMIDGGSSKRNMGFVWVPKEQNIVFKAIGVKSLHEYKKFRYDKELANAFAKNFSKVYSHHSKKELASENLKELRKTWNIEWSKSYEKSYKG